MDKPVICSRSMHHVYELAERAANYDHVILIEGESGVGKDILARYIAQSGRRASGPFVAVNCGALPEQLFEAEFFGYERGAFTNAVTMHKGFFEQAQHGVLLLDEVSELPLHMQVKLLRVLEERSVQRIGSERQVAIDVQVIVASNRALAPLVQTRKFRQDLYYRLAVFVIAIPPLRERAEDIPGLCAHFVEKHGGGTKQLEPAVLEFLCSYTWPGNVRQLESYIIRAIISSNGEDRIGQDQIGLLHNGDAEHNAELQDQRRLKDALVCTDGSIAGAARLLGVHRNTVYYRLRKLGIDMTALRDDPSVLEKL